ncbi:MAG: radical SAM protein [Nanoarchaeota archaeon]|nr:radical SAM protein [Nanoarchaeota archaeon]
MTESKPIIKKKAVLINSPRLFFHGADSSFGPLPLAIAFLDTYLNDAGIDTQTIDLNILLLKNKELCSSLQSIDSNLSYEQFIAKHDDLIQRIMDYLFSLIDLSESDIVGISIVETVSLKIMVPFMKQIKKRYPLIKIVVGGGTGGSLDHKYLFDRTIDFLIRNNFGEDALVQLIKCIREKGNLSAVDGIVYLKENQIRRNTLKLFDISKQVIRFNKSDIEEYRFRLFNDYEKFNDIFLAPILPIYFSKGCQFQCSFCTDASSKFMIHKKPDQIVRDLKDIKKRTGYKYFNSYDFHLTTFNKESISELCDRIIDSNLDILWINSIKPLSHLSQKVYHKLREAGCIQLIFGAETGSEKIMKLMNKGHSVADSEKNIRYSHKAGIWNRVNIIIGFPRENESDFQASYDFLKRNYDSIDQTTCAKFILRDCYLKRNPEKFNIIVRNSSDATGADSSSAPDIPADIQEYDEIGGLQYPELKKKHQERLMRIESLISQKLGISCPEAYDKLLFPLYDMLHSKDRVKNFLSENKDILQRFARGYNSLFTGTFSNQKIKGNLHQSSIDEFNMIPFDKLIRKMREIYASGYENLTIFGGEPLIRKDIFKLLSGAKNMGFKRIIVKTNARMLAYPEFCDKMAGYVDEILVISHSCNEKEYDLVSGVKGSFSQSIKGINNWKKLNKRIRYYS